MNTKLLATMALTAALNVLPVSTVQAADKEKCYGIAQAGQNDCANIAGTHSCAAQATLDDDIGEWKLVAKGTCADLGGFSKKQATDLLKQKKS